MEQLKETASKNFANYVAAYEEQSTAEKKGIVRKERKRKGRVRGVVIVSANIDNRSQHVIHGWPSRCTTNL